MKSKKFQIVTLLLIMTSIMLFLLYDNHIKSKRIEKLTQQVKILQPKYTAKDTTELLNLVLYVKEFEANSKLLDSTKRILISTYPFFTRDYSLTKFGKKVEFYYNPTMTPWLDNEFVFDEFKLYQNDSAYIYFKFSEYRCGCFSFKIDHGKWVVKDYEFGRK